MKLVLNDVVHPLSDVRKSNGPAGLAAGAASAAPPLLLPDPYI
jgi:hypothetical protein